MEAVRTFNLEAPNIDAGLVEREIASGVVGLRFSEDLERFYELETRERRAERMIKTGLIGISLFNLFLLADYLLIPDVIQLAVFVRAGVVTPLAALLLSVMWQSRSVLVHNLLSVVIMVLMTAGSAYVMDHSRMPQRELYNQGVLLIIIYGALLHRPAFWAAVLGTAGINLVFSIGLLADEFGSFYAVIAIQLIVVMGSIFTLVVAYWMERESRLFYLLSLRARLHSAAMEGISYRDALTGLYNRRALDQRLQELSERMPGSTERLAVIILDIDHFKIYNDRLGHQAGDDCLRQVASLILSQMREGRDQAFRYGGEEFLLLIHEADSDQAIAFADIIRRAIESRAIPHPESSAGPYVTASFGIAMADDTYSTPSDVIALADMALYAAKSKGRNCVWPGMTARVSSPEVLH